MQQPDITEISQPVAHHLMQPAADGQQEELKLWLDMLPEPVEQPATAPPKLFGITHARLFTLFQVAFAALIAIEVAALFPQAVPWFGPSMASEPACRLHTQSSEASR